MESFETQRKQTSRSTVMSKTDFISYQLVQECLPLLLIPPPHAYYLGSQDLARETPKSMSLPSPPVQTHRASLIWVSGHRLSHFKSHFLVSRPALSPDKSPAKTV